MSVREEEQKKNCPSGGLGLAAAAIGVGVGAALYYLFNKRTENPDSEASTSREWACDHQQALHQIENKMYKRSKNRIVNNNINETPKNNNKPPNHNNNNTPQSEVSYDTDPLSDTSAVANSDFTDDSQSILHSTHSSLDGPDIEQKNFNNSKTPNHNNNNKTPQSATSYFTLSENTTTDTSMFDTDMDESHSDIEITDDSSQINDSHNSVMDDSTQINDINDSQSSVMDDPLENNVPDLSALTVDSTDNVIDNYDDFTDDNDESTNDSELNVESNIEIDIENETVDEASEISFSSFNTDEYITDNYEETFTDELSPSSFNTDEYITDTFTDELSPSSFNTDEYITDNDDETFTDELSPSRSESDSSDTSNNAGASNTSKHHPPLSRMITNESEADISGWEVTETAAEVPEPGNSLGDSMSVFTGSVDRLVQAIRYRKRLFEDELARLASVSKTRNSDRMRELREQAFRDRSWTLEECAICFDVMLKDQPLMALPCTHNFHVQCIGPWLEEKHTCPICRKAAE